MAVTTASNNVSQSRGLLLATSTFAVLCAGWGLNAIVRPWDAVKIFELEAQAAVSDPNLVEGLMALYGSRDIFMGLAILHAVYSRDRKVAGWLLIGNGVVAVVDGAVCRMKAGRGEWPHWGCASAMMVVGGLLLGLWDKAQRGVDSDIGRER